MNNNENDEVATLIKLKQPHPRRWLHKPDSDLPIYNSD